MMGKHRIGLYVGRFQPVHNGHIHAVKHALSNLDELVVGIGSAQYSHDMKNPFTAGERFMMLRLGLDENNVNRGRYWIVPIPDTHVHSIWVAQVVALAPKFEMVFSNDPLVLELFRETGFHAENIPYAGRRLYNATNVRKKILSGENWEALVPRSVAAFIKEIRGVERMRDLNKTDNPD